MFDRFAYYISAITMFTQLHELGPGRMLQIWLQILPRRELCSHRGNGLVWGKEHTLIFLFNMGTP